MTKIVKLTLFMVTVVFGACEYVPPDPINNDSCVYYCWQRDGCEPFGSDCNRRCEVLLHDENSQCREEFEMLVLCGNDDAWGCDNSNCCEFCVEETYKLKTCLDLTARRTGGKSAATKTIEFLSANIDRINVVKMIKSACAIEIIYAEKDSARKKIEPGSIPSA